MAHCMQGQRPAVGHSRPQQGQSGPGTPAMQQSTSSLKKAATALCSAFASGLHTRTPAKKTNRRTRGHDFEALTTFFVALFYAASLEKVEWRSGGRPVAVPSGLSTTTTLATPLRRYASSLEERRAISWTILEGYSRRTNRESRGSVSGYLPLRPPLRPSDSTPSFRDIDKDGLPQYPSVTSQPSDFQTQSIVLFHH
jgi:hypothetical protein